MYPVELENKDATESKASASYLDLLLSIETEGHTSIYYKRDSCSFHVTNSPFQSSNIRRIIISQIIRYAGPAPNMDVLF